jgi:hypothetical protein
LLNSLDRHLRRPEEHDGLPFHAHCPVCHQRAAGTLPSGGLVSHQTQAALAAGVMAVSVASPAPALAQQPNGDPSTAQAPAPPADPTLDPDWQAPGPEGESGSEGLAEAPPATDDGGGAGEEEPGAVESEPTVDALPAPDSSEVPPAGTPDGTADAQPPAPQTEATPPPTVVEQPGLPADGVGAPTGGDPAAGTAPAPEAAPKPAEKEKAATRDRSRRRARQPAGRTAPAAVAPEPVQHTTTVAAAAPSVVDAVSVSRPVASDAPIKGDTYRVQSGDSLWSIAERLLGTEASTAEVARKVHRLWTINEDRIATGDPDLLRIGTMLRLP